MLHNIYIARQPILDTNLSIIGYELLFRSIQSDGSILPVIKDNLLATSSVLVNTLNHIGMNNLVGNAKAFVNIDTEMLLDNMILMIPKERFIIEILEHTKVTDRVIKRIKELKELGYTLALDDASCETCYFENFEPIFPYIDILKLDIKLINTDTLKSTIKKFKKYDFKLLAEKVETEEDYLLYKELGCDLFQGYFFAKPNIVTKEVIDPHYKNIFNLIRLLDQDIELDELSNEFEQHADITLQLLRFMNSGQLNLKTNIRSIKHAISLLGKHPLKNWLLLIAYSKSDSTHISNLDSPLLQMVNSRSLLMYEMMQQLHNNKKESHEAAFVGMLSLIDTIVQVPLETVLDELHVDQEIHEAILEQKGELGMLLKLAVAVEEFQMEDAHMIVNKLKVSPQDFKNALLTSMQTL